MSKTIKILIYLIFAIFCTASYGYATEKVVNKIVAIVNDEIITQSEVEESMLAFVKDYQVRYGEEETENRLSEAKSDALNRLIEEKLILQEAKKRNIKINEVDVEQRLEEVKKRFPSEEEFDKAISESGISIEKLRIKYRDQLMMKTLVSGIVANGIRITPTQIAAYYYGHKDEFTKAQKVKFRIILLRFRERQDKAVVRTFAEEILKKINSGEDFATLAKQYSEGPNAQEGGEMDFVTKGSMAKEIDDAIFSLKENEVSGIIDTSLGCNIVRVEKIQPPSELLLEEATPTIREMIFEREAELILREFMDNLKKDAYIQIKS